MKTVVFLIAGFVAFVAGCGDTGTVLDDAHCDPDAGADAESSDADSTELPVSEAGIQP